MTPIADSALNRFTLNDDNHEVASDLLDFLNWMIVVDSTSGEAFDPGRHEEETHYPGVLSPLYERESLPHVIRPQGAATDLKRDCREVSRLMETMRKEEIRLLTLAFSDEYSKLRAERIYEALRHQQSELLTITIRLYHHLYMILDELQKNDLLRGFSLIQEKALIRNQPYR